VPIHRQGAILAVIGVGNNPRPYDEADVANTQLLADFSWELVERKRREDEREHLVAELSRSNTDLEQFAYVASHDLRAPLRAINHLATWLEEDLKDVLTQESQKHLHLLRLRVRRMDRFLEDLLAYSRAGRISTDIATTDVRGLFTDVVELVAPPPGFSVAMKGDNLTFDTVATPLRQVLTNLISNAIKHHDRATGTIEFSVRDLGNQLEFAISDDGPGIEPQFFEKIFGMFQTLRRRDEVEGSGIGLALVRRIVALYGGTVAVSCPESRGTTFTFTWPKEPPARDRHL
jgi:light-regulated signal transduction histidine kinase (bacteriophytochrome)